MRIFVPYKWIQPILFDVCKICPETEKHTHTPLFFFSEWTRIKSLTSVKLMTANVFSSVQQPKVWNKHIKRRVKSKFFYKQIYSMHIVWFVVFFFFHLAFHWHFSSYSVLNHLLSQICSNYIHQMWCMFNRILIGW